MTTNYVTRDSLGMYAKNGTGPGPALMGAETLLGNDVYNEKGEDLGDIKEFMIDMATGRIAYAVLSFGGMLGLGDKLFAVPWTALTLDTTAKRFTLNALKDSLKDAPWLRQGQLAHDVRPGLGRRPAQVLPPARRGGMIRPARPRQRGSLSNPVKENHMNKDQVKGTVKDAAGKVQQTTGKLIGSTEQQLHGIKKQVEGQTQKAAGDVKEAVKDGTKK